MLDWMIDGENENVINKYSILKHKVQDRKMASLEQKTYQWIEQQMIVAE